MNQSTRTDKPILEILESLLGDRVQATLSGGAPVQRTFSRDQVRQIVFQGGVGRDRFLNLTDIRSTAAGGADNDFLQGGTNEDVLIGGPGNDVLIGGGALDLLLGGPGKNRLLPSPPRPSRPRSRRVLSLLPWPRGRTSSPRRACPSAWASPATPAP